MFKRLIPFLVVVMLLSGCGWIYQIGSSSGPESDLDISKAGLAVPTFEFINQDNEKYGSNDLQGKYWLANMIFTNCQTVCPTMTPNMLRIQDAMNEEGIDVTFVSFSVDPDVDTPGQLKEYARYMDVEEDNWQFLTGYTVDDIADFADESFGTIVQKLDEGDDIMHSTKFYLIDPEGNVIRHYDGMKSDQTEILEDLRSTVQ